jgi:hypothetical protein
MSDCYTTIVPLNRGTYNGCICSSMMEYSTQNGEMFYVLYYRRMGYSK